MDIAAVDADAWCPRYGGNRSDLALVSASCLEGSCSPSNGNIAFFLSARSFDSCSNHDLWIAWLAGSTSALSSDQCFTNSHGSILFCESTFSPAVFKKPDSGGR